MSTSVSTPTCDTCGHYRAMSAAKSLTNEAIGECREGPPVRDYTWPRTKANGGCARHTDLAKPAKGKRA